MQYLRQLMESRPYFTRIPDQQLIASPNGTGEDHIRATRDQNGVYTTLYLPNASQTVDVQMSILHGDAIIAQWYDPRNGISTKLVNLILKAFNPLHHPTMDRIRFYCWIRHNILYWRTCINDRRF